MNRNAKTRFYTLLLKLPLRPMCFWIHGQWLFWANCALGSSYRVHTLFWEINMITLSRRISWHYLYIKNNLLLYKQSKTIRDYHDFIVWLLDFLAHCRTSRFYNTVPIYFQYIQVRDLSLRFSCTYQHSKTELLSWQKADVLFIIQWDITVNNNY